MDNGKENVSPIRWDSPSPKKEERKEEELAVPESTPVQDSLIDGMDDEDSGVLAPNPPSSPFQTEAFSVTSEGIKEDNPAEVEGTELSRKRSHEEICVDEEDENDDDDDLRPNQGLTIAVDKMVEEHERKQRCVENNMNIDDSMEAEGNAENHQDLEENRDQEVGNNTINEKLNEGMSTVFHEADGEGDSSIMEEGNDAQIEEGNSMDDTCLSNFSAVPNADMTLFSKMRQVSPAKRMREERWSPSKQARDAQYNANVTSTPGTVRRDARTNHISEVDDDSGSSPTGSPTPRKGGTGRLSDTTNLLDFTDQFNAFAQASQAYKTHNGRISTSPSRRAARASPSKAGADSLRTPAKFNLLDFDIPPAPTPRSIPTITPRELESLKSSFLSEISSLKATLSGKDAEVTSLKEAVADAERRVGEALEEVRNECAKKEALEVEQGEWERRGKDMEEVLKEIRAEIMEGEREIAKLNKRAEEAEKGKEQLEGRIVELESQLSAARKAAVNATPSKPTPKSDDATSERTSEDTAREVQDAVEKVARELHTLYKGKHETKVAALKKSYEARWEKRVRDSESKLQKAVEENDRLRTEKDATMSGVVPGPSNNHEEEAGNTTMNASLIARDPDEIEAEKRVIEARLKGMEQEMAAVKQESEMLRSELKAERTEKGELVAVVDEWMNMQQQQQLEQQQKSAVTPEPPTPQRAQPTTGKKEPVESARPTTETLTRSIARPGTSGMRPPTAMGTSKLGRFGMPGGHTRGNSGGAGRAAPLAGGPGAGRSGIMSSIERMGRGGGGV